MGEIRDFLKKTGSIGRKAGHIKVGSMASGAPVTLPYVAVRGAFPGKTLWLHGQVHGDEINGIVAALDFLEMLDPGKMRGNVVFTPTGNPQALDSRKKRNPYDDLDLDQCYPGNSKGLISERCADALMREIEGAADFLINLHTMNPLFNSKAYAVYKVHPDSIVQEEELLKAISFFRPNVACRMRVEGTGELPGNIAGGLDYQCLARNIPAFMLELGGGSRYEKENVLLAQRGFAKLAVHMDILESSPYSAEDPLTSVRRVTKRGWITFSEGGIFVPSVQAGETLRGGDVLGITRNILGDLQETFSLEKDGIVIGLRGDPVSHTGERVAFIAWEWDEYAL